MKPVTYTYNLERYDKDLVLDGSVNSIFVSVMVTDSNNNMLLEEYYLSLDEINLVLKDENNLNSILTTVAATACLNLQDRLANTPPPPIIADPVKLDSFTIDPAAVILEANTLVTPTK